jgi:hypothetical protein
MVVEMRPWNIRIGQLNVARFATVGVVAKSAGSGEPNFTSVDAPLYTYRSFETDDFLTANRV